MRIIAGRFRGRPLRSPSDRRVRPTADRVREAWFSIVAEALPGANVLDLYAGSGALGLEALSRGAERATFVELNPGSLKALRANIEVLDVGGRAEVRRGDAFKYAGRLAAGACDVACSGSNDCSVSGNPSRRERSSSRSGSAATIS